MTTYYLTHDWEESGVIQIESDNPNLLENNPNAYLSFQDAQKAILKLIREQENRLENARKILAKQSGLGYTKNYRGFDITVTSKNDLYIIQIEGDHSFDKETKKPLMTLIAAFDYAFELIDNYHAKTTN